MPGAACTGGFSGEMTVLRRPCRPQRWCSVLQLAELLIYESRFTDHHSRFLVSVISKQAQEFWALLKTYPKQIAMPLPQARETDTRSEDFTSEPVGVNFMPAPEVDGLWAEIPEGDRTILYFFGGGFVLGSPDAPAKDVRPSRACGQGARARAELSSRARAPLSSGDR